MNPLKCECCDQHLSPEDQEVIEREKAELLVAAPVAARQWTPSTILRRPTTRL